MVWRRRCLTRTSATAEISISAPLSTHALRFCATSQQDSDGVEEEERHLHTSHRTTSNTKRLHTPPSRWPTFLLAAVAAQPTARLSYGRTLRARTSWIQGWKRRLRWAVSAARHRRHRRHVMGGARWAVRQVCQMRCAAPSAAPGTRSGGAGTARYCARRATSRRARPVQQPPSGAWAIACTQGTAACAPCRLARRSLRGRPQPKRLTRWLRAALRGPSG